MKKLIISSLVLAAMLLFTSWSFAGWNESGFKNSPLFKHSLNEAVTNMENQGKPVAAEGQNVVTSGTKCVYPEAQVTSLGQPTCYETCEPTQCGGECYTQAYTCSPTVCGSTCAGTSTCEHTCSCTSYNRCQSTCSGNTCTFTCVGTPGICIAARFYGTMKWKNTYWNWPSGGSTSYGVYLSPYYNLIDYDYWYFIGPEYGGFVNFLYGPGYDDVIDIALFSGSNGSYDNTKAVPKDESSFKIQGIFGVSYGSEYKGNVDGKTLIKHKPYNSNNIGTTQINVTYP